jgi:CsoR family transcriptional regulator, copper-sensing transcriptional repressor
MKTTREQDYQQALQCRLNRIRGQVDGLKTMVENEVYCDDILIQVAAVKAALNGFADELLKQHLKTCVTSRLQSQDELIIDELMTTLKRLYR